MREDDAIISLQNYLRQLYAAQRLLNRSAERAAAALAAAVRHRASATSSPPHVRTTRPQDHSVVIAAVTQWEKLHRQGNGAVPAAVVESILGRIQQAVNCLATQPLAHTAAADAAAAAANITRALSIVARSRSSHQVPALVSPAPTRVLRVERICVRPPLDSGGHAAGSALAQHPRVQLGPLTQRQLAATARTLQALTGQSRQRQPEQLQQLQQHQQQQWLVDPSAPLTIPRVPYRVRSLRLDSNFQAREIVDENTTPGDPADIPPQVHPSCITADVRFSIPLSECKMMNMPDPPVQTATTVQVAASGAIRGEGRCRVGRARRGGARASSPPPRLLDAPESPLAGDRPSRADEEGWWRASLRRSSAEAAALFRSRRAPLSGRFATTASGAASAQVAQTTLVRMREVDGGPGTLCIDRELEGRYGGESRGQLQLQLPARVARPGQSQEGEPFWEDLDDDEGCAAAAGQRPSLLPEVAEGWGVRELDLSLFARTPTLRERSNAAPLFEPGVLSKQHRELLEGLKWTGGPRSEKPQIPTQPPPAHMSDKTRQLLRDLYAATHGIQETHLSRLVAAKAMGHALTGLSTAERRFPHSTSVPTL